MKFLLILIAFTGNFGKAQTLKTTGRLIDYTDKKIPSYCGYQTEYGVLVFKLSRNVSYFKVGDTILIFQTCPREAMEREVGNYLNGKMYSLEIGKKVSTSDTTKVSRVLKKDYPNEYLRQVWYGTISRFH